MTFHVASSLKNRHISCSQFLNSDTNTRLTKLVVGVLIFSNDKVLLLKRAAAERHYPNIWELPSGKVESEDETILDAAARECFEETGLMVTAFVAEGRSFEYTIAGRGLSLQLNFIVKVREGDSVRINPEEHQAYQWYAEQQIEQVGVTEATMEILKDTFNNRKKRITDSDA